MSSVHVIITNLVEVLFWQPSLNPQLYSQTYPFPQLSQYKIHYALSHISIQGISNQYHFQVKLLNSTLTTAIFSLTNYFSVSLISAIIIRGILYSPKISSDIFVGQFLLLGSFNSTNVNVVSIPSLSNFSGAIVQSYIVGIYTNNSVTVELQNLPTGLCYVNNNNQFNVSILVVNTFSPLGFCKNISFTYVVIKKQLIIQNSQISLQFMIYKAQSPGPITPTTSPYYLPPNQLFNSFVQFGFVKLKMNISYTYYFGQISLGNFRISYVHSDNCRLNLILVKNISSSGQCCGINHYDWGSNQCSACKTLTNYIVNYPSNICLWMCSTCCSQNINVCLACIVPQSKLVSGGCTNVNGCIEVISYYNFSQCVKCNSDFKYYDSINNKCVCEDGFWQLAGLCTNIRGCTQINKKENINKCIFCNKSLNLILNSTSNNCVCILGYTYNTSQNNCTQICGDGRLFIYQCDDGNNIDGDGCSSTCKVERNFICIGGNSSHPSTCYVKLKQIKLFAYFIGRVQKQHKGQFIFKIKAIPNKQFSQKLIAQSLIICDSKLKISQLKIQNGFLKINVDYFQNLQGKKAILQLIFNPQFIQNNYLQVPFTMISRNIELTIQKQSFVNYICLGVIFLRGLAVLLSFFNHKFSGPQNIHSSFFILVIYFFSNTKPLDLKPLQYLSYLNLNIMYLTQQKINISEIQFYDYGQSEVNASIKINFCVIIISILMFVMHYRLQIYSTIFSWVYNRILFPINFSFIYISIFSGSFNFLIDNQQSIEYLNFVSNIYASILCSKQFLYYIYAKWQNINNGQVWLNKNEYLPIYMVSVLFNMFLINACSLSLINNIVRYIFVNTLLMLIVFCYLMPYQSNVNNLIQILNLFSVLYFSFWFILRQLVPSLQYYSTNLELIFIFILFLLSLLIIIKSISNIFNSIQTPKIPQNNNFKAIQQQYKNHNQQRFLNNQQQQTIVKTNLDCHQGLLQIIKNKKDFKKKYQKKYQQFRSFNFKKYNTVNQ